MGAKGKRAACPDCDGTITRWKYGLFTDCPHCGTALSGVQQATQRAAEADTWSDSLRLLHCQVWYAEQLNNWAEYRSRQLFKGLSLTPIEKLEVQRLQDDARALFEERMIVEQHQGRRLRI